MLWAVKARKQMFNMYHQNVIREKPGTTPPYFLNIKWQVLKYNVVVAPPPLSQIFCNLH